MEVKLYSRQSKKLEDVPISGVFKKVGSSQHVFMVVDLTQVDGFKEQVVLRTDVMYVINLASGVLTILPKNTDVEIVTIDCQEIQHSE